MQQQLKPMAAVALIDRLSSAWCTAGVEVAACQRLSALLRRLTAQSGCASVTGQQHNTAAPLEAQTGIGQHGAGVLPCEDLHRPPCSFQHLCRAEQLMDVNDSYNFSLKDSWRNPLACFRSNISTSYRHQTFAAGRQYSSSVTASIQYQLDEVHTAHGTVVSESSSSFNEHGVFPRPRPKVVAVALSGGVDSAVSALLLKQQGYEVFGVYMHNWDPSDEAGVEAPACSAAADLEDAKAVAAFLKIPLYEADFVSKYWNNVFEQFLEGLEQGLTPNPDLACNSHIKFGALLDFAKEKGAEVMATGHYARLGWVPASAVADTGTSAAAGATVATAASPTKARKAVISAASAAAATAAAGTASLTCTAACRDLSPVLLTGADSQKDQSYFLAGLNHQQLAQSLFPVGHLSKLLVRSIAAAAGLAPAVKRSSAGICFIGRRSFGRFLENYLRPKPGVYVDVMSGKTLGPCSNMLAVTIGQHAVGLGGQKARMYVAGKDLQSGVVYVAAGLGHPALFSSSVLLQQPNWVAGTAPLVLNHAVPPKEGTDNSAESPISVALRCDFKARYRQVARQCDVLQLQQLAGRDSLLKTSKFCGDAQGTLGSVLVADLCQPSRAVTPGQAFVMYDGEVCLGSAVIAAHGPTLFEQQLP